MISTWTAWYFSNFGGIGQSRYLTLSPGSGTYSPSTSEICTNITSPFASLSINPCPLDLLNDLTVPVSIGFEKALADVESVLVLLVIMGLGTWRWRWGLPSGEERFKKLSDFLGVSIRSNYAGRGYTQTLTTPGVGDKGYRSYW